MPPKKLQCVVIADPSQEAASHIASQTGHLAERREIATTGEQTLRLVAELNPEALVLSLELTKPDAVEIAARVHKSHPELFIVATFRELAVPMMNRLDKAGVEDFIPQPIDFTQLYRAASQRFNIPFRRHTRYGAALEVFRADGVLVGRTRDISEGGLQMDCYHPAHEDQSMLVDVSLGGESTPTESEDRLRVRCQVLAVDGEPPQTVTARVQFQNLRGDEYRRLAAYLSKLADDSDD